MTSVAEMSHNNRVQAGQVGRVEIIDGQHGSLVVGFGAHNSGLQAGIINGPVTNSFVYSRNQSIFGSLAEEARPFDISTKEIIARRNQIQAGRRLSQPIGDWRYEPYTAVKNRSVKARLLQIARLFQFLDRGFAEYFEVAVPSFGKDYALDLLTDARKSISNIQNSQTAPDSVEIGDLGHFCEQIAQAWNQPDTEKPKFFSTIRREEDILQYLRDALEIPYWEFMADLFLIWRANSTYMSGDVVLRVVHSLKLDILDGRRHLLDEIASLQEDEKVDITPILKGIDARIAILDSVWDSTSSSLEDTHHTLVSFVEKSRQSVITVRDPSRRLQDEQTDHQTETVTLIASILLFLIAAIIPGYKAFAISMQSGGSGSTKDADFWYLIQSSIMAVMGNIIMVVPLLRKSWFSPAYGLMWTFFAMGLGFAGISIVIYPLLNTGWSSMVAFFGSIASAASVMVMTQATAKEVDRSKIKQD